MLSSYFLSSRVSQMLLKHPPASKHTGTHLPWAVATFQSYRDGFEWFYRHKKIVGEVFLYFHWDLGFPSENILKD